MVLFFFWWGGVAFIWDKKKGKHFLVVPIENLFQLPRKEERSYVPYLKMISFHLHYIFDFLRTQRLATIHLFYNKKINTNYFIFIKVKICNLYLNSQRKNKLF